MTKFSNPFCTLDEAVAVLRSLGAKPKANPFKYDESQIHWQEHILSISAHRVYDEHYVNHFEVGIHIDLEGLRALTDITGLSISREHHSDGYDALVVRPGTLLKVMALEAKEATTS